MSSIRTFVAPGLESITCALTQIHAGPPPPLASPASLVGSATAEVLIATSRRPIARSTLSNVVSGNMMEQ